MTSPESNGADNEGDSQSTQVPAADPAYATPPPEGLPDADNE
jgi:hypothetical protein